MSTIASNRKSTSPTQDLPDSITPTYSIHIKRVGDDEVKSDPFPGANIGDTVRYYTHADGEVLIEFTGPSPFRADNKANTTVPGGVILTVVSESVGRGLKDDRFQALCFIEVPDPTDPTKRKAIGYRDAAAGNNLRVPRP